MRYALKSPAIRKILCFVSLLLIVITIILVSMNYKSRQVKIEIGDSIKYSTEEINNAIQCVMDNFNFPASSLTKVWYEEETSNKLIEAYLKNKVSSSDSKLDGDNIQNVIVILSNFKVDSSGDNPVLTPNMTYRNYSWTLIRADEWDDWTIDSFGM